MANGKLATFNPIAFTGPAAEAFADEMHTRYIVASKAAPENGSNSLDATNLTLVAITKCLEAQDAERAAKELAEKEKEKEKESARPEVDTKKFEKWPAHAKRLAVAICCMKEIKNDDDDVTHLQKRTVPTDNWLAIINATGVAPARKELANGLKTERHIVMKPCDATVQGLRDGTLLPDIEGGPSATSIFCFGRVDVGAPQYETTAGMDAEMAKSFAQSEGQGYSDAQCQKSAKLVLTVCSSIEEAIRMTANGVGFWSYLAEERAETCDLANFWKDRLRFLEKNRVQLESNLISDPTFANQYLIAAQDCADKYLEECAATKIGKSPSTQPLDAFQRFEDNLAACQRAWIKIPLPKYLEQAIGSKKAKTELPADTDDTVTEPEPKRQRMGKRVTNETVNRDLSTKAKHHWGKFLQIVPHLAPVYYRDYCLNFHVRGLCFDDCAKSSTHNQLSEQEYADLWQAMEPICKACS